MAAPVEEIYAQIGDAAQQPGLTAADRMTKLRGWHDELTFLLGRVETYMADIELVREGEHAEQRTDVETVRENADFRDALIERNIATAAELDALGYLSHQELDRLAEEGRLLEAASDLRKYTETLHPRDRSGKFRDKPGEIHLLPKGRHGGSTPRVLHTHSPRAVQMRSEARAKAEREAAAAERDTAGGQKGRRDLAKPDVKPDSGGAETDTMTLDPPYSPVLSEPIAPAVYDDVFEPGEDDETVQRNLARLDELGLNEWPEKGDTATRILGDAVDTEQKFTVQVPGDPEPITVWDPEREKLHDQIIDMLLRRRQPDANGELSVIDPKGEALAKPDGKPRVLFMAGGSASGKSTALRMDENKDVQPPDAVLIDPDEIKGMLPEYHAMVTAGERYASSGVHEESSFLAKRLQREAMARGLNVIVDGTGDSNPVSAADRRFTDKMRAFRDHRSDMVPDGYDVSAFYVNAATEKAVVRAARRATRTGRWVPRPAIEGIHRGVSQRFSNEVLGAVDEGLITDLRGYQTDGPEPTKMFHLDENGKFVVLDEALHSAFLAKGDA